MAALCILVLSLAACSSQEKPYPSGPVKIVVARGAGGSTDQIVRVVTPYLERELGVPVVVENVPGAGGADGNSRVYQAKPDGYTLLFAPATSDIIRQVGQGTSYDYMKLTPLYNIGGKDSNFVFVNADSPIQTFADFVSKAKTEGVSVSKMTGVTMSSISLAWLVNLAGIPKERIKPVPFEDGRSQALAVAGGHIEAGLSQASSILSLVRDGKLRVIVNFGKERNPLMPDVQNFDEVYPGEHYYEYYQGFMGPPGMPAPLVEKLNAALDRVVENADFRDKAKSLFTLVPLRSERYAVELASFFETANKMKPDLTLFEIQ